MESIIQASPAVTGAVICGMGQFQSSLLVETASPPTTNAEQERLLDEVWPFVERANKGSPYHGRIHRDMVIFTTADKPMPRAGKGTIQRQAAMALYASDLNALYASTQGPDSFNGKQTSPEEDMDISKAVREIIDHATDIDMEEIHSSANLFEFGLDSLQVAHIAKQINKLLAALGKPPKMAPHLIYSNASLGAVVSVVETLCKGKGPIEAAEKSAVEQMQDLWKRYTANLPVTARAPQQQDGPATILLTGSTGSLGSYILDSLIQDSRVAQIYCLNRGSASFERQKRSQAGKGLGNLPAKVICLDGDFLQDYFGLPVQEYKILLDTVFLVIHNAWQVNFNLPLDTFTSHVSYVRRLVDFSSHTRYGAGIFFVSSISSVANCASVTGLAGVPEAIVEDWSAPHNTGYGQSKYVSECILNTAAKVAGVPTAVCRVGQVAGPTTAAGMWPKQEWFPSLVASAKYLGKLPSSLGGQDRVEWIPVDVLARSVVELALCRSGEQQAPGATVYHAVNPRHAAWKDLAPVVLEGLSSTGNVDMVPFEEWVEALRDSASHTTDIATNPGVKLLDFFEGLATTNSVSLDTANTVRSSSTLAGVGAVEEAWVRNWMKQWSF